MLWGSFKEDEDLMFTRHKYARTHALWSIHINQLIKVLHTHNQIKSSLHN